MLDSSICWHFFPSLTQSLHHRPRARAELFGTSSLTPFMQGGGGAITGRPLMPRALAVDVVETPTEFKVKVDAPGARLDHQLPQREPCRRVARLDTALGGSRTFLSPF